MSLFRIIVGLFILYTFLSCQNKSSSNNKLMLTQIGNIVFRRSYAGHEHWSDEKLDSVKRENPEFDALVMESRKDLIPNLEKAGLIQNGKLQIDKYNLGIEDTIKLVLNGYKQAAIYKKYNKETSSITLQVSSENEIAEVALSFAGHQIDLSQADLFQDSSKEIIVLDSYYFMNGDMYNLMIYEVEKKTKAL